MSVIRPAAQPIDRVNRVPMRRMLVITPLVAIALGAAVMGARARQPDNQIVPGVHVGELDLGGKTYSEARPALEQWAARKQAAQVSLHFAPDAGISRTWKPDAAKLGLSVNIDRTLEAAEKAGRESFAGQVSHMFSGPKTVQVAPVSAADDARLTTYLKRQIASDANRKPKNAKFVLARGGGFGTHHEVNGIAVDVEGSAAAIKNSWAAYLATPPPAPPTAGQPAAEHPADGTSAPPQDSAGAATTQPPAATATPEGPEAELVAKVTPAAITSADLDQINTMLGAKSSYVNGTESRAGNIRIASSHINGTLLKPGDVFSYNQTVGPRNEDDGYRVAPILIGGKHDKGIGGGICQTSGTLFNAVLKSGLKIVQRECHSAPIGYLPMGLDATVSYGSHDLKFQNDTGAPVYIAASMRGRELTFSIFGKQVPGREVKLVQGGSSRWGGSYETQHDRSKPVGYRRIVERASSGGSVTWYRLIKEDGKVIHRDVISSHYVGHPGIVVVGTGPRKARPAKTAPAGGGSAPAVTPGAGGPAPPSTTSGTP